MSGGRIVRRESEALGMRPEATALNVTDRIDALAAALRAARIPAEQTSSILASAATAAMHAVTLDALLDGAVAVGAVEAAPAAAAEEPAAMPIRLAA